MARDPNVSVPVKWPVFICYRQDDGREAARWLAENLHGHRLSIVPDGYEVAPQLEVYFDERAPAVEDWTRIHQPALERARAFLMVCSPAAMIDFGEADWVQRELLWWIENRDSAPLVIDSTGAEGRYVPQSIKERWPNAQRTKVQPDLWDQLTHEGRRAEGNRALERILGGIQASEITVRYEDLERERERTRVLTEQRQQLAFQSTRLRRQRSVLSIVVVGALVAAGLATWFGISAQRSARVADSRELAARAESTLGQDSELALLLAIEAIDRAPTIEAEDVLHRALNNARLRAVFAGHSGPIGEVALNTDGSRLYTAASDGTVGVWDTSTGERLLTIGEVRPLSGLPFAITSESQLLATLGENSTITVWNANTGAAVAELPGHPGRGIERMVFSPDAGTLASAARFTDSVQVRLWDTSTWSERTALAGHESSVVHLAFDPSGSRLATSSHDATVKIWDVGTGSELLTLRGHDAVIWETLFTPDGERVVTGSHDGTARVWDSETGIELATLSGHTDAVWDVAIDPGGTLAATASNDGTAKLWDLQSGEERRTFSSVGGEMRRVAFSPDGSLLVSAGADATATLWDVGTGREIARLTGHTDRIWNLRFDSTGALLATASDDGTARLWNVEEGGELALLSGHRDEVTQVEFTPDGTMLVTTSDDGTVRFWSADEGDPVAELPRGEEGSSFVAISARGDRLVVAGEDGTAALWEVPSGVRLAVLSGHSDAIYGAAFSPDGRSVVTASLDGTVRLWDGSSGAPEGILGSRDGGYTRVVFSPDGNWIAAGTDDESVWLWNATTREESDLLWTGGLYEILDLSFSPDSRLVAASGFGAWIWDRRAGGEPTYLSGHGGTVFKVSFSPRGDLLATASADGTVRLWTVLGGEELATLRGHLGYVYDVAFNQDGSRLASASEDGTVRLWDASTGEPLVTLSGHRARLWDAAFSPDGSRIATASADATARIYPLDPNLLVELAHGRVTRALTPEECRRFLHLDGCPGEIDGSQLQDQLPD